MVMDKQIDAIKLLEKHFDNTFAVPLGLAVMLYRVIESFHAYAAIDIYRR
jgi:hypothetical protein